MESNPRDYGEQCRFDAFCKKVLRNEARAYLRNMKRQREREAFFSDLSQAELDKLCVMDRYPSDSIVFSSHGYTYRQRVCSRGILRIAADRAEHFDFALHSEPGRR